MIQKSPRKRNRRQGNRKRKNNLEGPKWTVSHPPAWSGVLAPVSQMELQTRAGVALSIVNATMAVIVTVVFSIY